MLLLQELSSVSRSHKSIVIPSAAAIRLCHRGPFLRPVRHLAALDMRVDMRTAAKVALLPLLGATQRLERAA